MNKEKQPPANELRNIRSYTWRSEWVRPYESLYSVFRMFSKINVLPYTATMKIISSKVVSFEPSKLDNLKNLSCSNANKDFQSYRREERVIQFFLSDKTTDSFPVFNQKAQQLLLSSKYRYCPECIKNGYHSWLYQYKPLKQCPIHKIPLEEGPFSIDLWAEGVSYHPALQNIDTVPLGKYYRKVFGKIKALKIFTPSNHKDGSALVKKLSNKGFFEAGEEIYTRRVGNEPEVKKVLSEHLCTAWKDLFENVPNKSSLELEFVLKAAFRETEHSQHCNPLYYETYAPLLQIYISIMELALDDLEDSEAIQDLFDFYRMAVDGKTYYSYINFYLIFHPSNGSWDEFRASPAYVDHFLEQRSDLMLSTRLNESDWELVCIDDHIKYQWNNLKRLWAGERSGNGQQKPSWELIDKLHNIWYLMIVDFSDILHVYRYVEE